MDFVQFLAKKKTLHFLKSYYTLMVQNLKDTVRFTGRNLSSTPSKNSVPFLKAATVSRFILA